MDTNKKGEIAKLKVELMAAELGWISSRTVEGSRYDLVLDNGKKLYRTQVKYADGKSSHSDGSILVGFRKAIGDDRNKNTKYQRVKKRTYNQSEIDVVLVYVPKVDKVCWIGPDLFDGKPSVTLRYEPPKNGQKKGVHLISDFLWSEEACFSD